MQATAIVLTHSLAYVEEVFSAARERRTLVGVLDASRTGALQGISVDRCVEPAELVPGQA
jgi:hypothetical protein